MTQTKQDKGFCMLTDILMYSKTADKRDRDEKILK